jgi:methylaspartate ammonia-lyase
MKNENVDEKNMQASEPIVIADECGDSMWDAVLGQEVKACQVINDTSDLEMLLNRTKNVKECDATEAKYIFKGWAQKIYS